jgi:hypothetical protein
MINQSFAKNKLIKQSGFSFCINKKGNVYAKGTINSYMKYINNFHSSLANKTKTIQIIKFRQISLIMIKIDKLE